MPMFRPQVFYKTDSGFKAYTNRIVGKLMGGTASAGFRIEPGYAATIEQDVRKYFRDMRKRIRITRNAKGEVQDMRGALNELTDRAYELGQRMARHTQMYDSSAAEDYRNLRQIWGKPIRVNAQDMREVRNSMNANERLLVNTRGGRDAVGADVRAMEDHSSREYGYTNAEIILNANSHLNAARSGIWRNYGNDKDTIEYFTGEYQKDMVYGFERADRRAWGNRRKSGK